MAVRVRLRIRVGSRVLETSALVNTGFESSEPSILLPKKLAESLGMYPPKSSELITAHTVGGEVFLIRLQEPLWVNVVAGEKTSREVAASAMVSGMESEVLISDYLAGELMIQILSLIHI